jgi:beta-lactamase class A
MKLHVSRRDVLASAATLIAPAYSQAESASTANAIRNAHAQIAALENRHGGRLGVAVLDTGSALRLGFRVEERFPMCSTFKLLAVSAVLKRVDHGTEQLDRKIPYGPGDLLNYAPVTKAHVGDGAMTIGGLCAAAIEWSDNTAANLLLRVVGGPEGYTQYARSLGDTVTRLDRYEPMLSTAIPGDDRDTTSPQSMLRDMQAILLGQELSPASRLKLQTWLIEDKVSAKRLRAGLPPTWRIGDKTGTGDNGTANTLGILWPPGRSPILAAVYYTGSAAPAETVNAAHAEIARIIVKTF